MANYFWVGGNGTWDNANTANWAASSGGAGGVGPPLSTDTVTFDASSGTGTCTTGTGAVCSTLTFNSATVALVLGNTVTCSGAFTLTSGSISLGSNTLVCTTFSSSNSNTRSIAFGTGKMQLTGSNTTLVLLTTSTGFTATGSLLVESTYSGSTGTRTFSMGSAGTGATEANALSISATSGSDIITLTTNRLISGLNLTGFSGTVNLNACIYYGDITISAGLTIGTITGVTLSKTSATQKITTNGKTLECPVVQNGVGGTVQLQDNLTMGSTRTFTLTAGTLDLTGNSGNWTLSTGIFNSSNSNTRAITFGTGNITLTNNAAIVWNMSTTTNFSYAGAPTINSIYAGSTGTRTFSFTTGQTQANALNFNVTAGTDTIILPIACRNFNFTGFSGTLSLGTVGTSLVYGNFVLSSGMTITGGGINVNFSATSGVQAFTSAGKTFDTPLTKNNAGTLQFQDAFNQGSTRAFTITNGTVQFKNGVTSTVGAFATSGTNQKFLQSTTPGSQATLSQASGTVNASYLTIRDINATGGATWNSFVDQSNVDAGNNDGWDFGISPIIGGAEYTYQLRSFTQPRRF